MEGFFAAAFFAGVFFAVASVFYTLPLETLRNFRQKIDISLAQKRQREEERLRRNRLEDERNQRARLAEYKRKQSWKQQQKRKSILAKQLQLAFMQIGSDPNAKRLRSWALAAKELPQKFRRRQYGRFESALLHRLRQWESLGVNREELRQDLRDIAEAMGVAQFEADYLMDQLPTPVAPPPLTAPEEFDQRLRAIHREHQSRMSSLKTANLDPELLEELIETEEQRYREQLLGNRGAY